MIGKLIGALLGSCFLGCGFLVLLMTVPELQGQRYLYAKGKEVPTTYHEIFDIKFGGTGGRHRSAFYTAKIVGTEEEILFTPMFEDFRLFDDLEINPNGRKVGILVLSKYSLRGKSLPVVRLYLDGEVVSDLRLNGYADRRDEFNETQRKYGIAIFGVTVILFFSSIAIGHWSDRRIQGRPGYVASSQT